MRRREFIAGLGGAAALWPLHADAQQSVTPMIGYLALVSGPRAMASFRQELSEAGYVDGANVRIEFCIANNQAALLRELAADLVRSHAAVIVAPDGPAIGAAKAATSPLRITSEQIPIVFTTGLDPVKLGWVASLNRPGGNITGAALITAELVGKQLDLLHQMVPRAAILGYLSDPSISTSEETTSDIVAASRALGTELIRVNVRTSRDIGLAFETLVQRGASGLVVANSVITGTNGNEILMLAAQNKIAAMYPSSNWVRLGGLMSYGASDAGFHKLAVDYVVRILKGAKPADLPVQRPTAFDFVINLKTAETLGLTIPPTLLVSATELIE
jgi:putative tryptophan/tyrosine transport system substrate-binding protein